MKRPLHNTLPKTGYLLGPGLFLLILMWPSAHFFSTIAEQNLHGASINVPDIQAHAWSVRVVLGLLVWMVSWWVTEAVPIPVTALLPGVL